MKILELFAGSRSVGKVAESLGHEVFSVDINQFKDIDLVKDIEYLDVADIPFTPDMIWASCPCTDFSVACIGKKWVSGHEFKPRDPNLLGIELLNKTIEIIKSPVNRSVSKGL